MAREIGAGLVKISRLGEFSLCLFMVVVVVD